MGLMDFPDFDDALRSRLASACDRLATEFEGIHGRETVSATLDASARELSGGEVTAFLPILAERFARERLRAQAQSAGRVAKTIPEVLFVSLTGGGREQIGAALLARRAGDAVSVHSAGSNAVASVDPSVRAVLEEVGVDLTEAFTKPISPEVLASADVVITMGRSVGDFELPETVRHLDWRVGDPAGADVDEARRVRDDIERRIEAFVGDALSEPAPAA
jgi:arsenate reductase (thioredoxin)